MLRVTGSIRWRGSARALMSQVPPECLRRRCDKALRPLSLEAGVFFLQITWEKPVLSRGSGPGLKTGTNHALLTCYSNCYKISIVFTEKENFKDFKRLMLKPRKKE